jgi:hypothetical protein
VLPSVASLTGLSVCTYSKPLAFWNGLLSFTCIWFFFLIDRFQNLIFSHILSNCGWSMEFRMYLHSKLRKNMLPIFYLSKLWHFITLTKYTYSVISGY